MKSKLLVIQPTTPAGSDAIQPDERAGFMIFEAATGALKCEICEYGYTYSGIGIVKKEWLNCYFNCETESYRMYVSMNAYDRQGKVVIERYKAPNGYDVPPVTEYWEDTNMDNNVLDCSAAPPTAIKTGK